ncbi:hypothetical protein PTKIN_Ptkin10aG0101700 [Pterospermum kingtungense]
MMASPLSATAHASPHFSCNIAPRIHTRLFAQIPLLNPLAFSYSSPLISLRSASLPKRLPCRFQCAASSTASFGTGGGGDDGSGGGGGEGGDRTGSGDSEARLGAIEADELSADFIILNVGGMSCGGCAASVKRILESQPQVSSAAVDLATETAVVWPVSEAKVVPNWQKELGDALATHLTTCGFKSTLRGEGAFEGDVSQ